MIRRGPVHEAPETSQQREEIQRATVSAYIERFRDDGTFLIDVLIGLRKIVPNGRPRMHSPKTTKDIEDGVDTMQWAVGRL
jgi:hypothetical protein